MTNLPSALKLQLVCFPGIPRELVCDSLLGRPRVLILENRRLAIFDPVHGLSHPSGKATLAIVTRSLCLAEHAKGRAQLGSSMHNMCSEQGGEAHDAASSANCCSRRAVLACPCGYCWPFHPRSRSSVHFNND